MLSKKVLEVFSKNFLPELSSLKKDPQPLQVGDIIVSVNKCNEDMERPWSLTQRTKKAAEALCELGTDPGYRTQLQPITSKVFAFFKEGEDVFKALPHGTRASLIIAKKRFDGEEVNFIQRLKIKINQAWISLKRYIKKSGPSEFMSRNILSAEAVRSSIEFFARPPVDRYPDLAAARDQITQKIKNLLVNIKDLDEENAKQLTKDFENVARRMNRFDPEHEPDPVNSWTNFEEILTKNKLSYVLLDSSHKKHTGKI